MEVRTRHGRWLRLGSLAGILFVGCLAGHGAAPVAAHAQAPAAARQVAAPRQRAAALGAHLLVSQATVKAGDEQIVNVTTRAGATVDFAVLYPGGAGVVTETVPNADLSGASLSWIIPGYVPPGTARVAVTITLGGQKVVKVAYFTITTPITTAPVPRTISAHVAVTGTQVLAGTPETIIVSTRQGATVNVKVTYPDGAGTVSTMIPAADLTGAVFTWPIPATIPGGTAQVEVTVRLGHAHAMVMTTFTIMAAPSQTSS